MNYVILLSLATLLVMATTNCTSGQDPSPTQPNPNLEDTSTGDSQTAQQVPNEDKPIGYPNWKTKTVGGQQFWTDVRYVSGWRIQQHSETGHYRLLDPSNTRHAWGNLPHCNQTLDRLIVNGKASRCRGKVVIVLHGLFRTSRSMQPIADFLQEEGDYTPINFQYSSTRNGVGAHAAALKSVIDNLGPAVTEINFVGHSLGNIVVRHYLHDTTNPQTDQQGDPRIGRIVMIGPPNRGSKIARLLKDNLLFQTIAGVSGEELAKNWDELQQTLATPTVPFGIIAGGQLNDKKFSNFVLEGQDDFTVGVEETKLAGAHDFLVRPLLHTTMMHQPAVLNAALSFLANGYFVSEEDRTPLVEAGNEDREDSDAR